METRSGARRGGCRRWAFRRAPALVALPLAVAACRSAGPMRPGINLSSASSDYSPTARLAVALGRDSLPPDERPTLVVRVDSGTIAAPGTPRPGAPAIMRELEMRALLVRFDAAALGHPGPGDRRPWSELAASEPVSVLDSLHYGEQLPLAPLRFVVPLAGAAASPGGTGIVFEITAAAVTEPIRMADGSVIPGRVIARGVRVYACSSFTIDGRRDRRRERALDARYTATC